MLFNHVTTSVISTHRLLFLSFGLQLASAAAMLSWVISLLSGCTSQAAGISSLQVSIVWLFSMVCFYLISEASLLPPLLTVFLCFVRGWRSSFFFRYVIVFGGWHCALALWRAWVCLGVMHPMDRELMDLQHDTFILRKNLHCRYYPAQYLRV